MPSCNSGFLPEADAKIAIFCESAKKKVIFSSNVKDFMAFQMYLPDVNNVLRMWLS